MKTLIIAAALAAAAIPAVAQTNVSIQVGQPGFYGRIDLGGYAPPPVVYAQPVIVERQVRYVAQPQPVYLRVPPGHMKHWSKHCGDYNACGQQVYFVRDDWYANTYAPRYREEQRGRGRDHDDGDHNDGDHNDGDHERGHGKGHGKHKD